MNIVYHPIQFLGYEESGNVRYAHLEQEIDCISIADEENLQLFGFENKKSIRTLLYQVPQWHNDFQSILARYPMARIIRAISHSPLMTATENVMVQKGYGRIESYIERQLVRFNNSVYLDRIGLPVYAQNKLSLTGKFADQDYRIVYTGAEIEVGEAEPILAFQER